MISGGAPAEPAVEVEVLLVHFGSPGETCRALDAVARTAGVHAGLTVIDNGPGDTPATLERRVEAVRHAFPRGADLLRPGENRGYFGGLNAGIRHARSVRPPQFFFFMNHDLLVAPDAIQLLVSLIRAGSRVAAAGPVILLEEDRGRVWNAGSDIEWPAARPRSRHHGRPVEEVPEDPYPVGFLAGCAFLMSAESLERLGPLPEEYFLFFEDADLGERIREAGFLSMVEPRARVWHRPGTAMREAPGVPEYYRARNRLLFSRHHGPPGLLTSLARARFALGRILRGGARAAGARDGWAGRAGPGRVTPGRGSRSPPPEPWRRGSGENRHDSS